MKEDEKKEEKEAKVEVISAIYKVNIHCKECAREIKKPLLKTQGVYSVDIDCEKCEVKIKGEIDVIEIHKKIENLSKKKVELISPKMEKVIEQKKKEKEKEKEKEQVKKVKEETIHITSIKVHIHCKKCEQDLRKKLLKHKAIYSVQSDMKKETLTIKGTIESEKLVTYIRKKVHKHAEIIVSKKEENGKKKEEVVKVEEKVSKIVEFKEEVKVMGVKDKEGETPYFVHYVYAPQYFSDENPNACFIL